MALFNSYNRVVIVGNMTRDIELRTLPSGMRVADIAIAVNDRIKKGEEWVDETTFVDVTVWGKTAELLQRFSGKGKQVLIEGRLRQDKWVDKTSGQNRSKMKVVADAVTILGSNEGRGGGSSSSREAVPSNDMPYAQNVEDEGLPF